MGGLFSSFLSRLWNILNLLQYVIFLCSLCFILQKLLKQKSFLTLHFKYRRLIEGSRLPESCYEFPGFPVKRFLVVLYLIAFSTQKKSPFSSRRSFISAEESQEQSEKLDGMHSTKHKAMNLTPVFSNVVQPQFLLCFPDTLEFCGVGGPYLYVLLSLVK